MVVVERCEGHVAVAHRASIGQGARRTPTLDRPRVQPTPRRRLAALSSQSGGIRDDSDDRLRATTRPQDDSCAGGDGSRGVHRRQRLHRARRGAAGDREAVQHRCRHGAVGDQRLRADVRRADRRRRPVGRHLRAKAHLHPRRGDLRGLLGARRGGPEHGVADLLSRADGDRRSDDVAGDPRHDLRGAAGTPAWPAG